MISHVTQVWLHQSNLRSSGQPSNSMRVIGMNSEQGCVKELGYCNSYRLSQVLMCSELGGKYMGRERISRIWDDLSQ